MIGTKLKGTHKLEYSGTACHNLLSELNCTKMNKMCHWHWLSLVGQEVSVTKQTTYAVRYRGGGPPQKNIWVSLLISMTAVRSGAEISLLSLDAQHFSRCIISKLSACTHMPHREGNSMGGLRNQWFESVRYQEYLLKWKSFPAYMHRWVITLTDFTLPVPLHCRWLGRR